MPSKRMALLLVVVFVLFFNLAIPQLTRAQRILSPQAFKSEMQLRAVTPPAETTPENAPVGSAAQFIATSTQRIDRDEVAIGVYRNGKPVALFPRFHELVTATPADHQSGLDKLVGSSVTLVPSEKQAERWDLFTGVGGVGDRVLADNIFKVRQVLLSSRKNPIEVRVDGQIHRLKPGQALLVM